MKKLLASSVLSLMMLFASVQITAQVAINIDGTQPDNSSMLDLKSTSKGMLVPRMTATERDAISNPATGLLIFCSTNNQFYSNKGTPSVPNWMMVSSQWISSGLDIYFSGGKVGVGTSSPDNSAILDLNSSNKGFLPPRIALSAINVASPVDSPIIGLLIYNTATTGISPNNVIPGYYFWNGLRWVSCVSPQGVNPGDMLYWNGTQWLCVDAGTNGQLLVFNNGVPIWGGIQLPIVNTATLSDINATSAVGGGNVISNSGSPITARGVCWNTSTSPTTLNTHTTDGIGNGVFVSSLSPLTPNTMYFLRSYATNSIGTAYGNEINFSTITPFVCGNNIIYGGKTYTTVQIGTQCWFKQNLNVGTRIYGSQNQTNNGIIEKYCYNDLESNCDVYGGLYQWDAMMLWSNTPGVQGICPSGWHIPTDAETCVLRQFLDPTVNCGIQGASGTNSGGLMKEIGTSHWASPNIGATNGSGFTGLPSGCNYPGFSSLSTFGPLWTSSQNSDAKAWYFAMDYNDARTNRYEYSKSIGFPVRCLKNN